MSMSKQEFVQSTAIDSETVEFWVEQHWLVPELTAIGPAFSHRELARARLILDLKKTFEVNDEGIDVILHLLDQVHGLRYALAQLRSGSRTHDSESPRDGKQI